jgi:hypothetical protein
MPASDEPSDGDIRRIVREEILNVGRSLFSKAVWTILSVFVVLLGLQLIQFGYLASGPGAVGMLVGGVVFVGASLYLLVLLYR